MKEDVAELKNEILYRDAGFCVIDSLMDIIPGVNENDSGAMNQIFSALRSLVKQTGCSFLIIHHVNKANGDYRGSSAIKGAIDALYTLKSVKEKSTYKILEIEPTKTRYTMIHPIRLKMEFLEEKFSVYSYTDAEDGMDRAIEAHEKEKVITSIMDELKGSFLEDIVEKLSLSGSPDKKLTVYRKIEKMVSDGFLEKEKKGKRNFYSLKNHKK